MKDNIHVSVIIPTKNGEPTIKKCLTAIAEQNLKCLEVILIDSGSEDATLTIAAQFSFVKIIKIDPNQFNHGATRNLGVFEASGELLLFTVQDAYAISYDWIERMVHHFIQNDDVVGVCGQQIVPHDADKNPHEWFRPYSKPVPRVVQIKDKQKIMSMAPAVLHSMCGWDNVNAMYRKSILLKYPFDEVSFGEDMAWAKKIVLDGKKLVYDYNSRVCHYHHSTYDYTYRRTLTALYFVYKNFGYVREIRYNLLDYVKIVYRNIKYKVSPNWIIFNWTIMNATAQAYRDVISKLAINEAALDSYHLNRCGIPPQGKQNVTVKD